ncbi:MAG: YidC/Oxa1 family membrane protein insertase [Litorilinea sp.]
MRRKQWILLLLMLGAAFLLSGCGVNYEGVEDIRTTPPDGIWQQLVVWPMARALVWIDEMLRDYNVNYHWGWAIITFTVIVKLLTFPLTLSQTRSINAQKELQPRIQELQKKHGKDRERMAQEQMKLYREAGVNPLSGCLPLVVQMPILFGLYASLITLGPALANSRFYWIPDLGYPTYFEGLGWISSAFNAGDYGRLVAYLILPILLVVSQFVMQKWMTPTPPAGGDSSNPAAGMTRQLMLMMTFMFGFFTLTVPAGLTLYWVTSNLLQLLQQWIITDVRFGIAKPLFPAMATAGAAPALTHSAKNGSGKNGTGANANHSDDDDATVDHDTDHATVGEESKSKGPKTQRRRRARKR